jgi:hypothetical protein
MTESRKTEKMKRPVFEWESILASRIRTWRRVMVFNVENIGANRYIKKETADWRNKKKNKAGIENRVSVVNGRSEVGDVR